MFFLGTIEESTYLQINAFLQEPLPVHKIFIYSKGGEIDSAALIALSMKNKNTECYVKEAASAALQIVMPACKKTFVYKDTQFQFHAMAYIFSCDKFCEWSSLDILSLAKYVKNTNNWMSKSMTNKWGVPRCAFRGIAKNCLEQVMFEEKQLTVTEMQRFFPSIKLYQLEAAK